MEGHNLKPLKPDEPDVPTTLEGVMQDKPLQIAK